MKYNKFIELEIQNNIKKHSNKKRIHQNKQMNFLLNFQFQNILQHIKRNRIVLEVGSGLGEFYEFSKKKIKFKKLIITEISSFQIKFLKKKIKDKKITYLQSTAEELCKKVKKKSVDIIIAKGVVHHLYDVKKSFGSFSNILKKNGRLIIFEGNNQSLYRNLLLKFARFFGMKHEISQYHHKSYHEIIEIAKKNKFSKDNLIFIPGLIAPFCFMGVGNVLFFKILLNLNYVLSKVAPNNFSWWFMLVLKKN